jgi:hypothetical protein
MGPGGEYFQKLEEPLAIYFAMNFSITANVSSRLRFLCSAAALSRVRIANATACR